MDQLERRLDKVETDLKLHEKTINELCRSYSRQEKSSNEILEKLNRLLLIEEQAKELYSFHKLECRKELDDRYVMKTNFRPEVIEILNHIRNEDLSVVRNKSNILSDTLNIIWKAATIIGIIFIALQPYIK